MVRKHRVWFPGAIYHITARGIRKSDIFLENTDRQIYKNLLYETKQTHPFNLLAYCLMTNHVHLLIETIDTNTSIIFNLLHTKYAKAFNTKYEYSGHVFENRYGAELITSYQYLLEASRYIHLNPVKANIVERMEDYKWSSIRSYLYNEKDPLVTTNKILYNFSAPQKENYYHFLKTPPASVQQY